VLTELDPVDRLTAGAVGPPGARVFYLQARKSDRVVTLLVEKQQVQLLAASVLEILARVGKETGQGLPEDSMGLQEPISPEWRAGRLSIGYQEDRDLLVLEAEELLPESEGDEEDESTEDDDEDAPEDEDGDEENESAVDEQLATLEAELGPEIEAELGPEIEPDPVPERARFWATREQMLSLARHGAAVCAAGRPRCQLCGNPIDPEGHICPALNGHREQGLG
jgi:uncharacterized repeat protein (TIGR03847 family)